jgi:hypothetical protein
VVVFHGKRRQTSFFDDIIASLSPTPSNALPTNAIGSLAFVVISLNFSTLFGHSIYIKTVRPYFISRFDSIPSWLVMADI